ncbi:tetratricopeptide repeat protein [Wenzhouxiangella sp. EGI_FJ10305]|uniref:tetratricopeptide repeat protein n=1 Tax=Wenzhouxiangella sp. EGI_FJ10305 TaxID=3243768 RepID=UPI0035D6F9B2
MVTERFGDFDRADGIFRRVLELHPSKRAAFLEKECGDDEGLLRLLRQLLHVAESDDPEMASGGGLAGILLENPESHESARRGERFGQWQVTEEVGRGGMAVVYRGERADGAFRQDVAIKLLRGRRSEVVENRFKRERIFLARLNHPSIARLLDGGVTESGRSYIVMEYIEGERIDRYCDERKLSIDARLRLFLQVCDAVQFAHRQLIVHRDIKPNNILVTSDGEAKLLDFGIAKLLATDDEAVSTTQTLLAHQMLTPQYASPEQILGEPISTATDVYALGLLLYELLSGHRARVIESTNPKAIEQAICETRPPSPSRVCGDDRHWAGAGASQTARQIAGARALTPARLKRKLHGDLDNIVLMALRREPARRYGTAEQMLDDIRRYLEKRPVRARPDSVSYRLNRFLFRHTAGVAMATASLVIVAGVVAYYAGQLADERDRAELAAAASLLEAATAEQVADFLIDLFEAARPEEARGEEVTARDLLTKGAEQVQSLSDQPEVQSRLLSVIGKTYHRLGMYQEALPLYEQALDVNQRTFGAEHPNVGDALNDLGVLSRDRGDLGGAEELLQSALAIRVESLGEVDEKVAETRDELGRLLQSRGDYEGSRRQFQAALEIRRKLYDEIHPNIALSLNSVSLALRMQGDGDAAEPYLREALEIYRQLYGDEHPWTTTLKANLALLLMDRGRWSEAEQILSEVIAFDRRAMGSEHPELANRLNFLGSVYREQGRYREAHTLFEEALEIGRANLEPGHPRLSEFLMNHARVYLAEGAPEVAAPMLAEAVRIRRGALIEGHWRIADVEGWLGHALSSMGRHEQADLLLKNSYSTLSEERGEDDRRTQDVLRHLVRHYEAWGRPELADTYREQLFEQGAP